MVASTGVGSLQPELIMRHLLLAILMLSTPVAGFAADTKTEADQAGTVAKTFINVYVKASMSRSWNSEKWVASCPLVTSNFRLTLKKWFHEKSAGRGNRTLISIPLCPRSLVTFNINDLDKLILPESSLTWHTLGHSV
jgi:hypothetical protein